jgi:hypothetical protein
MTPELATAKTRLDYLIRMGRVDLYKPIQIAEVLHKGRTTEEEFDLGDVETFRNPSRAWRDEVTLRLLGKRSTSSARYQDDIWNDSAMPPPMLKVLDVFNRESNGAVEAYIYARFAERQGLVRNVISSLKAAVPSSFEIASILGRFESTPGLRRSVDKAYEIVAFALLDLVVEAMDVQVAVEVPLGGRKLLSEFDDLAEKLIGVSAAQHSHRSRARIYRVGVTNASDRGLDMWANFGPAIQVKHLSLSRDLADEIVGQLDADRIVIVCRDTSATILHDVLHKSSAGKRITGVVQQSDLVRWYGTIMKGSRANDLGRKLIDKLIECFNAEFPQATTVTEAFMSERGYRPHALPSDWCL